MVQIDIRSQCASCHAPVNAGARYCRTCGYAQPGAVRGAPVEEPEPGARAALLSTRPSRVGLVAFCAVVGLLLAMTVPVLVVRALFFGPDDAVRDYFGALANRDADSAWTALEPGKVVRAANPLLGSRALRDPGYTPPTRVVVTNLQTHGAKSSASVTFEVAGVPSNAVLELERGHATNLLQRWHLTNSLANLPVYASSVDGLAVAGTRVPATANGLPLLAFPGAYLVTVPDNPLVEGIPVTVTAGYGPQVQIQSRLKPSATGAVEAAVRTYLDACAKRTELAPRGCPFGASSYYEVTDVAWRIVRYPQVQLQAAADGSVRVTTTVPGSAQITGRSSSTTSPTVNSEIAFSVAGMAESAGGSVVFTPGF